MQQEQLLLVAQKLAVFWEDQGSIDFSMFSTYYQLAILVINTVPSSTAKAIQRKPAAHTAKIIAILGQLVEHDPAARLLVESLLGNEYTTPQRVPSSLPPISIQGSNNQISIGHSMGTVTQVMNLPQDGKYQDDEFIAYERGLHKISTLILIDHPSHREYLIYEQRLRENIKQSRLYGNTEVRKSERAEIIHHLNYLVLSVLNTSFNELCR